MENDARSHLDDEDTATSFTMVRDSNTRNPFGIIRMYRKGDMYRAKRNRVLQLKNQYPIDVFNSFVARSRQENPQHVDERSLGGHD